MTTSATGHSLGRTVIRARTTSIGEALVREGIRLLMHRSSCADGKGKSMPRRRSPPVELTRERSRQGSGSVATDWSSTPPSGRSPSSWRSSNALTQAPGGSTRRTASRHPHHHSRLGARSAASAAPATRRLPTPDRGAPPPLPRHAGPSPGRRDGAAGRGGTGLRCLATPATYGRHHGAVGLFPFPAARHGVDRARRPPLARETPWWLDGENRQRSADSTRRGGACWRRCPQRAPGARSAEAIRAVRSRGSSMSRRPSHRC